MDQTTSHFSGLVPLRSTYMCPPLSCNSSNLANRTSSYQRRYHRCCTAWKDMLMPLMSVSHTFPPYDCSREQPSRHMAARGWDAIQLEDIPSALLISSSVQSHQCHDTHMCGSGNVCVEAYMYIVEIHLADQEGDGVQEGKRGPQEKCGSVSNFYLKHILHVEVGRRYRSYSMYQD